MLIRIFYLLLDIIFPARFTAEDLGVTPKANTTIHERMYAVFSYKNEGVKQMIKHLKRIPNKELCDMCARYMYDEIKDHIPKGSSWTILPIPITRKGFRKRGFNQSELLARSLVNLNSNFNLETHFLKRVKATKKQALIKNRDERLKNQVGSLRVENENYIAEKNILIVDDVITTGATCDEAMRAINSFETKPSHLLCIALSH